MSVTPKLSYEAWQAIVKRKGYQGFITNRNFSSHATSSEWYSFKNERMVYSASPIEKRHHFNLEFEDEVSSYFDQFPLHPEISERVCKQHGLRHHLNGEFVVTIDALKVLPDRDNAICDSVKADSDLHPELTTLTKTKYQRLQEKLLIEMLCAEEMGIEFELVTDKRTPKIRFSNLEWMYVGHHAFPGERERLDTFYDALVTVVTSLTENQSVKLLDIERAVRKKLGISTHGVQRLFALLCWRKAIKFNLDNFLQPCSQITKETFLFDFEVYMKCRELEITKSVTPYKL